MYFFYEVSQKITTSTPLGDWDLGGYDHVAVHMWIQGPGGTVVYPEFYFNGLSAASEKLQIGPSGPGGWNIAILTKVYPILAPRMGLCLYNPTAPVDFMLRLYAAGCSDSKTLFRPRKVLRKKIDIASLIPGPRPPLPNSSTAKPKRLSPSVGIA